MCESKCTCPEEEEAAEARCVCLSGDGGELFEQDVLTQRVQRDILPHIQTDGAHLETDRQTDEASAHVLKQGLRLAPTPVSTE